MKTYLPLSKFLTIKPSSINGLGLFATRDLPKDLILGTSHYEVRGMLIRTPLGGFYNHSGTPNCEKLKYEMALTKDYFYLLKTIRDISKGEEIFVKYTFYNLEKKQ